MVKYYNYMVVFREIPTEITLAINITNCPCHCKGCHSPFLWEDTGTELTQEELERIIDENLGVTCVCFMGGDRAPEEIDKLSAWLKTRYNGNIRTAWYSGREEISNKINMNNFDYIKVGSYIDELGGLDKETTNQRLYKVCDNGVFVDITPKMREIVVK